MQYPLFRTALFLCVIIVGAIGKTTLLTAAPALDDKDYPKVSPFEGVRWDEWTPIVQLNDQWYKLKSIDGVSSESIIEHCRQAYGARAKKRFAEDLAMALSEMGHAPGATVDLVIENPVTGEAIEMKDVAMTEANRHRIWRANVEPQEEKKQPKTISAGAARDDIRQLVAAMENQFSYLTLKNVDYELAAAEISKFLDQDIAVDDFALQLQQYIAQFGDGHSGVQDLSDYLSEGCLPFAVAMHNGRLIAFDPIENRLLEEEFPYIASIDGVEIGDWIHAVRTYIPAGSSQLQTARIPRRIVYINALRRQMQLPMTDDVTIELAGENHRALKSFTMKLVERPVHAPFEATTNYRMLDGNIGYLRIPSFSTRIDPNHVQTCAEAMNAFRDTNGLVIDVRGNGGGGREALLALFPYFMNPDEQAVVVNIAAYRLSDKFESDHLEARFMWPGDSPHWNDAERAAIAKAGENFKPEWSPPARKFSPWHYMVISRPETDDIYHYSKLTLILMDGDCFSATDIFLGAMKGRKNVYLVGEPSGGGSGRKQVVRLNNSGIEIGMSSMASYLPDGTMYDTNGIQPHSTFSFDLNDRIGKTDRLLDSAASQFK